MEQMTGQFKPATKPDPFADVVWTEDQMRGIDGFNDWFHSNKWQRGGEHQFYYIAGFAGTGKTFLTRYLMSLVSGPTVHAAYTGKAARVLGRSLQRRTSTIHGLIYKVDEPEEFDEKEHGVQSPSFILNEDSTLRDAALGIFDEVSMVNDEIGEDLLSFGRPLLVLGDPGQLPPVKGSGYFSRRDPDCFLAKVQRQALDSNILRLATEVREQRSGFLFPEAHDDLVVYPKGKLDPELVLSFDQLITGKHDTRHWINNILRQIKGHSHTYIPQKGERVLCLRNNRPAGLYNGMMGTMIEDGVDEIDNIILKFLDEDDNVHEVRAHAEGFRDESQLAQMNWRDRKLYEEFTWGYGITVHKSQGSQWENTCIVDDGFLSWKKQERARWLYTGITRAVDSLTIVKYNP